MFAQNYFLEVLCYILLLLLLYTLVRFMITSMTNLFKGLPDDQERIVDPFINNVFYGVSYWSEKGGRPYQEDRHAELKGLYEEDSSLYAVYDGHGGIKASQYCKDNMLSNIIADTDFSTDPAKALRSGFLK